MVPDPARAGSIEGWLAHTITPRAVVIEVTGDAATCAGYAARVRTARPGLPVLVVSALPVAQLDALRADVYLTPAQAHSALGRTLRDLLGLLGPSPARPATPARGAPALASPLPPQPSAAAGLGIGRPRQASTPVNVKLDNWDQYVVLYTGNLSRGGMFIRMPDPLPVGSPVHLRVTLPSSEVIDLPGEVTHVVKTPAAAGAGGQRPGIGIQLDAFPPSLRTQLDGYLARVRPGDAPAPAPAPARPAVPAPVQAEGSGKVGSAHALETTLASRLADLRKQDCFTALGLHTDADLASVRKSFLMMAKVWHPSRFALEPERVRELVAEIFIVLRRAHDMIGDDSRLEAYRQRLLRAQGTHAGAPGAPRAATTPAHAPGTGVGARPPLPGEGVHISAPGGRQVIAPGTTGTQGRTIAPAPPPAPAATARAVQPQPTPQLAETDLFAGLAIDVDLSSAAPEPLSADREIAEGLSFLRAGNNVSARAAFERGLQRDPLNRECRALHGTARAREEIAAGHLDLAYQLLQGALSLYPGCTPAIDSMRQLNDARHKQKRGLLERLLDRRGGNS